MRPADDHRAARGTPPPLVGRSGSANEGAPTYRLGLRRRRWESRLTAFSQLQPVAVRILEHCDIAPRVFEHPRIELHTARVQRLERLLAIPRLNGVRRRDAVLYRLGLAGCPWPENQLEVLPLDGDGQEPGSVGCRVVGPLLEAKDLRVEVERPVLV